MYNEEMTAKIMELFTNPLFKKNFYDFFLKMQMEGIESARKFWSANAGPNTFDISPEIFEKMVDFYIILGFVPRFKYDDLLKENQRLKQEQEFLRKTLNDLQNVFTEGGEQAREAWKSIIDKQFEMNKEVSRNFFELFRNLGGSGQSGSSK